MGGKKSKPGVNNEDGVPVAENKPTPQVGATPKQDEGDNESFEQVSALPEHDLDPVGRLKKKKGSLDSQMYEVKKLTKYDRNESTQSVPTASLFKVEEIEKVKFKKIEDSLQTGDLALLYRAGHSEPNFAIFVNHSECDPHFPLLFIKGKTKPMELKHFNKQHRDVRVITAVTRIFYGDYDRVLIRRLHTTKKISCSLALDIAARVEAEIGYTKQEIMFITEAQTPEERSRIVCAYTLARVYKELGVMMVNPVDIRPDTFQDALPLKPPISVKLPKTKLGPLITGDPPLLAQIA